MRQVDLDELTYQIFSGLRAWTSSVRKRVFAPPHKRAPRTHGMAADLVCRKLTLWEFLDPSDQYRQLSLEDVSVRLEVAIGSFPGAIGGLWFSEAKAREREAQAAAAILLSEALAPLEILSPSSIVHLGLLRVRFPMPTAPDHAFRASWP